MGTQNFKRRRYGGMIRATMLGARRFAVISTVCARAGALLFSAAPAFAAPEAPVSAPAQDVTNTTAVLEGTLNPGASARAGWYFAYSTGAKCTGASTTRLQPEVEGQALPEHVRVTGLEAGNEYKFCLVATNEEGESMAGSEETFKTTALAPMPEEASALRVSASAATLQARLNFEGSAGSYRFEYGTSTEYGSTTPEENVAAGPAAGTVESQPQSLAADTTYHYRLVVHSSLGGPDGSTVDHTFTTQSAGSEFQLPDGREWELVSPPEKHGAGIE